MEWVMVAVVVALIIWVSIYYGVRCLERRKFNNGNCPYCKTGRLYFSTVDVLGTEYWACDRCWKMLQLRKYQPMREHVEKVMHDTMCK